MSFLRYFYFFSSIFWSIWMLLTRCGSCQLDVVAPTSWEPQVWNMETLVSILYKLFLRNAKLSDNFIYVLPFLEEYILFVFVAAYLRSLRTKAVEQKNNSRPWRNLMICKKDPVNVMLLVLHDFQVADPYDVRITLVNWSKLRRNRYGTNRDFARTLQPERCCICVFLYTSFNMKPHSNCTHFDLLFWIALKITLSIS